MCECKKKNTEAAIAYLKENFSNKFQVSELAAGLVNEAGLRIDNRLVAVGFDQYSVWVQPIKKDGSRGNSKKHMVTFIHSYCPHCGEKYANE
jgi:hypothetical protein